MIDFINKKGGNPYENDEDYKACLSYSNSILKGVPLDKLYKELTYIKSSGTQYIDTGVSVTNNVDIEVKFECNTGSPDYMRIWGVSGSAKCEMMMDSSSITNWKFNNGSYTYTIDARNSFKTVKYYGDSGKIYVNDTFLATATKTGTLNKNLWLFRGNDRYSNYYLASCKIWVNNILTRDFIPVKDREEIVCLFDKISEGYYYNSGTGNFIPGEEV